MDKLKALLEKRAKIIADMRASIDTAETQDRDFTAEELAAYTALKAEKEQLDQRIERLQGQAISEAHLQEVRPAAARGQGVERVQRGAEARREFENIGEFLHAVRFNPNDQRLNFQEGVGAAAAEGENRAELRTDDGPSGGFVLPPQFRSTIMQMQPQDAIVRSRANVIEPGTPPDGPVTIPALDQTGAAPGNWFGGVQVNWIDEGGLKPLTDMKLREITLTPHEVAGVMVATDKLLRNWTAASSMIETQLRGAVTQAEDFAFILGNGVAKPLGVLNSKATFSVPRLLANNIKYADLVQMMARLRGNGTWFYSRSVLPQLMAMQDPAGRYIWQPSAVVGQPSTLLGMPAVENNRNPALGSRGDIWCADLSQYLIKDGSGPFVAASEHVLFQQNKTMIKIFWNVDGSPWLTQPVPLENGYLVSPFVALDVPAV